MHASLGVGHLAPQAQPDSGPLTLHKAEQWERLAACTPLTAFSSMLQFH